MRLLTGAKKTKTVLHFLSLFKMEVNFVQQLFKVRRTFQTFWKLPKVVQVAGCCREIEQHGPRAQRVSLQPAGVFTNTCRESLVLFTNISATMNAFQWKIQSRDPVYLGMTLNEALG